ncbi:hypothetical protein Tco_1314922 [Tanacetum coccineum]
MQGSPKVIFLPQDGASLLAQESCHWRFGAFYLMLFETEESSVQRICFTVHESHSEAVKKAISGHHAAVSGGVMLKLPFTTIFQYLQLYMAIDEFGKTISTSSEDSLLVRVNVCIWNVSLGPCLPPGEAECNDVYGLDEELLAMIPKPVLAMVMKSPDPLEEQHRKELQQANLRTGPFHDMGKEIYLFLHPNLMHSMLTSLCKVKYGSRLRVCQSKGPFTINIKRLHALLLFVKRRDKHIKFSYETYVTKIFLPSLWECNLLNILDLTLRILY